jgi:hypothetical protein
LGELRALPRAISYDLSNLARLYRIGSFVLLALSFWY